MQILFSITFNFKFQILAGFYVLAMLQEAADRVIYLLTFHIVSGHTLKHLSAAMVPIILTVMLAKRSVYSEKLLHVRNTQLHPIQMWIIMKDFGLKFQWKECWHYIETAIIQYQKCKPEAQSQYAECVYIGGNKVAMRGMAMHDAPWARTYKRMSPKNLHYKRISEKSSNYSQEQKFSKLDAQLPQG